MSLQAGAPQIVPADEARLRRLRWRCRRGMLENDLILARFIDASGASLTDDDIDKLDAVLEMSDGALWDVLARRSEIDDPALSAFVERLRSL